MFAEKGYANTTTKELAEAADMAEGTLYNYFEGKREILLAILQEMQTPLDDLLQNAHKLQCRADFVSIVEAGFDIFVSQLDFTRTLLAEIWVDDIILEDFVTGRLRDIGQAIQAFIAQGIEAGTFRANGSGSRDADGAGQFPRAHYPCNARDKARSIETDTPRHGRSRRRYAP